MQYQILIAAGADLHGCCYLHMAMQGGNHDAVSEYILDQAVPIKTERVLC